MRGYANLERHLDGWAGTDPERGAIAKTVSNLAAAGLEIGKIIARGPLAGDMAQKRGDHADGDTQKELDFVANEIVTDALRTSPVAWMGSEEDEEPIAMNGGAPLAVNVDPLDGSSNIDTNVTIGTIFSILPANGPRPLLQPGTNQLAAGFIVYGPQTALILTLGSGTHIFYGDPASGEFLLTNENVRIPAATKEYAINASNARHWDVATKAYIHNCQLGADGPRKTDFNTRWIGSLVADAFRIFIRGGVYLYPGDARLGYALGRLRLLYETNPVAFLVEQAGGMCTTGTGRVMEVEATALHQRCPLIFGSSNEVEEVLQSYREPHSIGEDSPLFSQRGLFRPALG